MPSVNYTPYGSMGSDIGNLGSLLFPDASKVMEGRYYGAKSREAQINALKGQAELNERPYIMGMTPGSGVQPAPAQYYHPSGSNPNDPPIIAPSTGITMQDGSSPSLSQTVTTPAPGLAAPGTPAVPPAQVAALAEQAGVHTGVPPASSSPAPNSGAPPAPTTTASNGTTPTNDPLSATIHPGTFWSADGGRKMAPPAQANGSPAPLAFNPNLYMAHMLAAGYTAQQAQAGLASYILQFKNAHVIDEPTADYAMSAAGNTEPLQARTSITTTGMNNATTLAQQRIVTGENARQFDLADTLTTDTPGGQPIHTPRRDSFGKPAYDASYSTQYNTPALTQPTPGGAPVSAKQGEVKPGTPMFNQPFTAEYNKPTEVSGPNGEKLIQRTGELPPGPTTAYSPEREKAGMTWVWARNKQTGETRNLPLKEFNADGGRTWIPLEKGGELAPNQMFTAQAAVDKAMEVLNPPPSSPIQNLTDVDLAPLRNDSAGNAWLVRRTLQLYKTDDETKNDWFASGIKAGQEGIDKGLIASPKDVAAQRLHFYGQPAATNPHLFRTQDETGTKTKTYFRPDLPPKLGTTVTTPPPGAQPPAGAQPAAAPPAGAQPAAQAAPVAAAKPPTDPLATDPNVGGDPTQQPNLSSVFKTLTQPDPRYAIQHLPPGALAVAPPGAPEGAVTRASGGTLVVARGGFIYPAQPSPEMGR